MNSRRSLFLMALLFLSFLIYQQWNLDYNAPKTPVSETTQTTQAQSGSDIPTARVNQEISNVTANQENKGKIITVETDVLRLQINTAGGDVIGSKLLKYNATLDSKTPYSLLQDNNKEIYIAQSGLIGPNGSDNSSGRATYQVDGDSFKLADGQNELRVPLTFTRNGVIYRKTFILKRGEYNIDVDFDIQNNTDQPIQIEPYAQLKHTIVDGSSSLTMPTFTGGAYSSSETNYKKYSFEDMEEKNLDIHTKTGWVAILQHYFVSAWVPQQDQNHTLYTKTSDNNKVATIGYRGPEMIVAANSDKTISTKLWTGPKLQNAMEKVAKNLDLTIDYGWAWFIAKPLFILLTFIHGLVHNWGLAIIVVTLIVKGCLYPLTRAQYTSMAKMRMLQPKIQEMRERYGDDRQGMSQAMMNLYKEEKVNPLGGCLPILLQMPIFIALYWVFMEAVELRHAPFFGWIQDLSAQDPYYILPILMGISMFLLQKMSPTPVADPMQQKVMMFMPVVFTGFFLFFPSGLVLYWLVSNLITIGQQQLIYRELEKKGLHSRKNKK